MQRKHNRNTHTADDKLIRRTSNTWEILLITNTDMQTDIETQQSLGLCRMGD